MGLQQDVEKFLDECKRFVDVHGKVTKKIRILRKSGNKAAAKELLKKLFGAEEKALLKLRKLAEQIKEENNNNKTSYLVRYATSLESPRNAYIGVYKGTLKQSYKALLKDFARKINHAIPYLSTTSNIGKIVVAHKHSKTCVTASIESRSQYNDPRFTIEDIAMSIADYYYSGRGGPVGKQYENVARCFKGNELTCQKNQMFLDYLNSFITPHTNDNDDVKFLKYKVKEALETQVRTNNNSSNNSSNTTTKHNRKGK